MSNKNLYLKVKDYAGMDAMYFKLNREEKSWSEVMRFIEDALEEEFSANDDQIVGVKVEAYIEEHTDEELIALGVDMSGEL